MNALVALGTIFRREMAAYFNAAIAYIFIIVFVFLNGSLYMTQFFIVGSADLRPFFITLPFILSVFLPAVTMRLWAEEKRGNTLELLLTFPMGTHSLVMGKFLASLLFYVAALAGTLTIPLMLHLLGRPDMGVIISGYMGAFFLGAFYLALGIFISGLCKDQIVAFILAMLICFGLHIVGTEFVASSIDGWIPGFGTFLKHFIGSAPHFDSFIRGVVAGGDVLYFVLGTGIFLALNGFWFEGRMKPGAKKIFSMAVVVSLGIFLVANWFLDGLPLGRVDMTEGKVYTVSKATKKILGDLKSPVIAKFYVSPQDKMPTGMKTLEQDVTSKLDEFRVASKGNFQYKVFHMEAANVVDREEGAEESLEEQLQTKGIQPFQVQAIESDEVAVRLIYASLSLAYKEKPEEIIPRVVPQNLNNLEYLVVSKIFRMTLTENPKITVVAPVEEKTVDPQMKALLEQLGGQVPEGYQDDRYDTLMKALRYEGYEVTRVQLSKEEPLSKDTKTLVVLEPKALNERQQFEIGKFLRGGGSVFMAVQNYIYGYETQGRGLRIIPQDLQPGVNPFLKNWGFEVDPNVLVDKQHDVVNLSGAARVGPFEMSVPVKVPIQVLVQETGMNENISITSRLSPIFYLWGTAISIDKDKVKEQGLKVETLFSSSDDSWTVPFQAGQLVPRDLEPTVDSPKGPLPLAILAQGQFADPYKDKEAPAWPVSAPAEGEAPEPVQEEPFEDVTPSSGKLILVGAASFLQKHLLTGGGHLNFFMNSIDVLTLGEELVTIRSKKPINRSIKRIAAGAKIGWRFTITMLIPIAIAIIGASRVFLRRKAKQNYLKEYSQS